MDFCWSTLHVTDLDESVKFYEDAVGMKVIRRFDAMPGTEIAFMGFGDGTNETQVELICYDKGEKYTESGQVTLGFTVDSVHGHMDFLNSIGVVPITEVICPNPTVKFFYTKDPNGISVQFVEHIDPNAVKDI